MKNLGICIVLLAFMHNIYGQEMNHVMNDPKTGEEILVGYCTKEALLESSFQKYIMESYESYEIDLPLVDNINMFMDNVNIVMIMGVWCEDSQREVPRFLKLIDHLNIPPDKFSIICLDTQKNAEDLPIESYKIEKVPTFIFYKNDKEIGRIVEKPALSLEKDIMAFFKSSDDAK